MSSITTSCLSGYFASSSRFLYFLTDENGECKAANNLFREIFFDKGDGWPLSKIFTEPEKLLRVIKDCMDSPVFSNAEFVLKKKNGERKKVSWEFSSCRMENTGNICVQAIGTIEKSEIEALGKKVGELAGRYNAYEQSPEGLWRFESDIPVPVSADANSIIEHWRNYSYLAECNDNMARMYGYERADELIGARLNQLVDFSDENRLNSLKRFIQNKFRPTLVETKEFDRYGNVRYFFNNMEGIIKDGMLSTVWGTQQDITEQKQAEEKIRYLAMLMENVSDIIISYDSDFRVVSWNKAAEDLFGYSAEEMLGKQVPEMMSYELAGTSRDDIIRQLQNEGVWKGEARIKNKYGKTVIILTTSTKVYNNAGQVTGYLAVSKDISEKRRTEDELARSEMFYKSLIAESADGITLTDEKGIIRFAAPSGKKILGYEPDNVIGRNIFEFVHPDDLMLATDTFEKEMAGGSRLPFINVRLLSKKMEWIWCVVRSHNMMSNPNVGYMVIYYFDDTPRKKILDELRNQAITLGNVFDLIITCDFNYRVLSWNKRAEQIVGYTEQEVVGRFLGDIARLDYGQYTSDQVEAILAEKGYWQGEISFINKSGIKKTILHTASFLMNEAGERVSIIGTGIDITEKKRAEEQLKESELFYRNLFVNSLDAILITDPSGRINFASPSVTVIFGYETEEVLNKITFDFAHPDDRKIAEEAFMEELTGSPKGKFISVRIKNKAGEWIWCIVRGHNLMENPYIRGMVVYLYDDSLRKKTEQALIESESRFRTQATLLSNVTDIIVTTDMEGVVTSWNKVSENLTGITSAEAVGRPYRNVIETNYSPFTNEQVREIVKNEGIWRGEISFTGFDGEKKYLLHTISLLQNEKGESTGMIGVGKDITERKKMEARLQQSESFYRSLAANSLDGIILTNEQGVVIHCGPSVFHISGYELDQLLGKKVFDFVHPDDINLAAQSFLTELNKESVLNYVVIRLRHATRGWVWCTVRGHNLFNDPVLRAMVIYFTDDTKRKQIEDRLRESESRFRNMIHNLKLGIILQNEKSEMLVCNQAALEMLGLTEEQLLGKTSFDPLWNVIHEDGTPFPAEEHPAPTAIRTRKPVRDVVMGVFRPNTNDRVWLLVNAEPVLDDERKIINVICSFADITEQRKLSQKLIEHEIQKQKLITQATIDGQEKERQEIGKELHDNINQHLTTTRLYLEVAAEKSSGEILEMISLAHKNLSDIVNEIRKLSQSLVPPTLGDLGLVESVQDLCDSLRRAHSFEIEFQHWHFSEENLPENMKLMIFRIIQEQISNIIRHSGAKNITIRFQSDAEYIIFSIEDDGHGFDTQQYKKGLGLGNITNRAALFDGRVEIESSPGKGCIVAVTIPIPEQPSSLN